MARILYGLSGEGFGHAARSKEVIDYLRSRGHEVSIATHDRGLKYLSEFYQVEKIGGFSFVYESNEVKYAKTVFSNWLKRKETLESLQQLSGLIEERQIDLVISDYEPLTALSAKLKRLPLISLDNQHVLTKTKLDYPREHKASFLTNSLLNRLFIVQPKNYLILSFFPCQPRGGKVFVFKPIVKSEILSAKPTIGDKILVYLTSGFEGAADVLKDLPAEFIVYGLKREGQDGNLLFKNMERASFSEDLIKCRAVIANAGFALISEALFLAKPYLAIPAGAQFEQFLNAYHLAKLGYGATSEQFTAEAVSDFLNKLEEYRQHLAGGMEPGNQQVFAKLDELIALYVK